MRNPTRKIRIGSLFIGGDSPIMVQSMCSTKTTEIDATLQMIERLRLSGAGLIRIAVDSQRDVQALAELRTRTSANLSVDLQENFRLAEQVAPLVDKIRYNPGHLHHFEPETPWQEKVRFLVEVAKKNDIALRIGVNCGSIDPEKSLAAEPMFISAMEHAEFLDACGFRRYCVSIKDSDPFRVLASNRWFAGKRPDIPLHLGVTEAGMPPWGIVKSRCALEPLLSEGIGDTLRVSLTVESDRKVEEIEAGNAILEHVAQGRIIDPETVVFPKLNIISCPSCSRVQNGSFIQLARKVEVATRFARDFPITIAVMGCRVNGPGETDSADIGLWCGPESVHLKKGKKSCGNWNYDEIIPKMLEILRETVHNM